MNPPDIFYGFIIVGDTMQYTEQNMLTLAQDMICRMEVQDLLNDAFNSLVEVYRVSPLHFQNDVALYATNQSKYTGPFMDLIDYFKDVIVEEGVEQYA